MKPKICRPLIVIFLFLCCLHDVTSVLELKPDNPFVYIGDILELNCTASDAVVDGVAFWHGNDEQIDSKYVHKLSNSTLQANIPIREEDKDIHTYICASEGFSEFSVQNLIIEYKPRPVENLTCQIYNWENLTCTWDLGPYIELREFNIFVAWKHAMMHGSFDVNDDKSRFDTVFRFYNYNFTITVTHNQSGKQDVSVSKTYDMSQIQVKPAAVKNLEIISEENQCVTLKVEHDLYHSNVKKEERNLTIRVAYSSKWELQPRVVEKPLNNDNITVCDVHPYSKYKFDVDVLPVKHNGVWSDVKSVQYLTNSTVPGSGPISTNGSYSQELCVNGKRRVIIFIQHVADRLTHGIMESYTAVYTPVSSGQQLFSTQSSSTFAIDYSLKCSTDYVVELKANNNFGTSTNNSYVYIPKVLSEPELLESDARLLITVVKESNASDKNVVAKWIGFKSEPLYYRLFWCKSSSIRCESDINWVEAKGDVTSQVIKSDSLNIREVEARKYMFSISAVYDRNISTPMIFANCIYQSWSVPKDPPELHLDKKNPERSLRVSWNYETCHSQSLVYVQSFNIYHCPTDEYGNCTAKYKTETIDSRRSNYQLTDLKAETNYSVWMQPVSPGGLGPESEKLYGVPFENYALSGGDITGIVFGILVLMSLIFFIISRICCRKYWENCRKKYVIKEIKGYKDKEEGMKSGYAEIDYYDNEIERNEEHQRSEEQVNEEETPKLKTQISDDSGNFSLIQSPLERGELPSISEEESPNNRKIMARSVSEMVVNEKPNAEENTTQLKLSTPPGEADPYHKWDLVTEDFTKTPVNIVDNNQSSVLNDGRLLRIPMNNLLPAPGNSNSYISNEAFSSKKPAISNSTDSPYLSNDTSIQHPPPQSSIHKDSNSSSSSSNSSPSHSTSTSGDSVPSYTHVAGINQTSSQSESSNVSGSQVNLELMSAEGKGAFQPAQEMTKLDNACSVSNKQTSPYVCLPTSNNFQDLQPIPIPKVNQNQNNGESYI